MYRIPFWNVRKLRSNLSTCSTRNASLPAFTKYFSPARTDICLWLNWSQTEQLLLIKPIGVFCLGSWVHSEHGCRKQVTSRSQHTLCTCTSKLLYVFPFSNLRFLLLSSFVSSRRVCCDQEKFVNAVVVLATRRRRVVSFRPQLRFSSVEVWSAMSRRAAHKISAFIKSQKHIGNNYQCSGSGVDEALPSARGWHSGELRATQRCLAQAARSWAEQAENEVLECDCNSVQPDRSSPGMPPNANLLMHSR